MRPDRNTPAFLFPLLLLVGACSEPAPTLTARVLEARGEVSCNGAPLGRDDVVTDGDEVHVVNGRLELEVPGIGRLRVYRDTKLALGAFDGKRYSVRVAVGRVWAIVNRLTPGRTAEFETDNAVAGVRGTELIIEAQDDDTDVRVLSGSVSVKGGGLERLLRGGERARVKKRDAPLVDRYDSAQDRLQWDALKAAALEIKEGFQKGGRAVRDESRSLGRKIRSLFK